MILKVQTHLTFPFWWVIIANATTIEGRYRGRYFGGIKTLNPTIYWRYCLDYKEVIVFPSPSLQRISLTVKLRPRAVTVLQWVLDVLGAISWYVAYILLFLTLSYHFLAGFTFRLY